MYPYITSARCTSSIGAVFNKLLLLLVYSRLTRGLVYSASLARRALQYARPGLTAAARQTITMYVYSRLRVEVQYPVLPVAYGMQYILVAAVGRYP